MSIGVSGITRAGTDSGAQPTMRAEVVSLRGFGMREARDGRRGHCRSGDRSARQSRSPWRRSGGSKGGRAQKLAMAVGGGDDEEGAEGEGSWTWFVSVVIASHLQGGIGQRVGIGYVRMRRVHYVVC